MTRKDPAIKSLIAEYNRRRSEIKKRIGEFEAVHKTGSRGIFSELCFCLLTANANALRCDEAIRRLKEKDLLFKGSVRQIKPHLIGRVRFHNKKADFIVGARKLFDKGDDVSITCRLDLADPFNAREWLVENIKGYGYKEASHFLRNIGLGKDIAILDRHILKNLRRYGVIERIPASLGSRKTYLAIEDKMRAFSRHIRIPLDELDLLFWSLQTGFIFK